MMSPGEIQHVQKIARTLNDTEGTEHTLSCVVLTEIALQLSTLNERLARMEQDLSNRTVRSDPNQ